MSRTKASRLISKAKRVAFSKTGIAILKGILAYELAFVLYFINDFRALAPFPIVWNGMFLQAIAGMAGNTVGEALYANVISLTGACIGAIFFVILAKLRNAPVGQGFVLAAFLYVFSYIKAGGLKFFGFSLIGILVAFSGIYTGYLEDGFNADYLSSYLIAYAFGGAISIAVCICVFPTSSERQLRVMLVHSLQNAWTFSDLLFKTYNLQITQEEKEARNHLRATLRADYGVLGAKLSTASFEVNYTRFRMSDYKCFVSQTKDILQTLIGISSGIESLDYSAEHMALFSTYFVTDSAASFKSLQNAIQHVFADLMQDLAVGHVQLDIDNSDYIQHDDDDTMSQLSGHVPSSPMKADSDELQKRVTRLTDRLRRDLQEKQPRSRSASRDRRGSRDEKRAATDHVEEMHRTWQEFKAISNAAAANVLSSGVIEDPTAQLATEMPQQSLARQFGVETSSQSSSSSNDANHESPPKLEYAADYDTNVSVMRVKGFLFALEHFVAELTSLRAAVKERKATKLKIRFHLFDGLKFRVARRKQQRRDAKQASAATSATPGPGFEDQEAGVQAEEADSQPELTTEEALALLGKGKLSNKPKASAWFQFWLLVKGIEDFFLEERSVYAFKTMLATLVFAVLLLAPSTRPFFNQYGLTSGLITIVVTSSPVLGQTLFTFILQVSGTGLGACFGMIVLTIFKDVGGYHWNPFGITLFSLIVAIPAQTLIYTKPVYFPGALLAMNAVGVLTVTEVTNQFVPNYASPSLRGAYVITSMSIALGISIAFALLILRRSARRMLRVQVAKIYRSMLQYHLIFIALVEYMTPATHPHSMDDPARKAVVGQVVQELRKREIAMQEAIIESMPLMRFSQIELSLTSDFNHKAFGSILKCAQVLLDRARDARFSLGTSGFNETIRTKFMEPLFPYRKASQRSQKLQLYLLANSLETKLPLPQDMPVRAQFVWQLHRDSLVLSARLAQTAEGRDMLRSDEFSRYWMYIMSISGMSLLFDQAASAIKTLFGELEDCVTNTHED